MDDRPSQQHTSTTAKKYPSDTYLVSLRHNLDGHLVAHNVMLHHLAVALTAVVRHEDLLAALQSAIQDVPETGTDQIYVPELAVLWHARVDGHLAGPDRSPFHVEPHDVHVGAARRGGHGRVRGRPQRRPNERRTGRAVRRLDVLDDARVVESVRAQGTDAGPDDGPLGQTLSG